MSGFYLGASKSLLTKYGYSSIYSVLYNVPTTNTDMSGIRARCQSSSSICVGGTDLLDNILLMACGNCYNIMTNTSRTVPRLVNDVWWYYTQGSSFGFAPAWQITQNPTDTTLIGGENRLSWTLTGSSGGYRVGTNTNLNTSNSFKKFVYLLY